MTDQLMMAMNSADSRPRLMYEEKSDGLIFVLSHRSVSTKDYQKLQCTFPSWLQTFQ